MGGLHLHLRQLALLGPVLVALSACGSDEVEIPETLRGEPTCMWIAGARAHFEDGSSTLILDAETSSSGVACTCMTREEWEAGGWEEELNAKALEICEDLATTYDHAWNECQEYYEDETWLLTTFWNSEDVTPPAKYDPGCIGE